MAYSLNITVLSAGCAGLYLEETHVWTIPKFDFGKGKNLQWNLSNKLVTHEELRLLVFDR